MFDIAPSEFLLVAIVALVVIGPKDLPKAMRLAGYWVGKARGVARQFRSGFDNMVREAELADMEKKWAVENERIMSEHGAGAEAASLPVADEVVTAPSAEVASSPAPSGAPAASVHAEPDLFSHPVMVETPVVEPAPAGTPAAADGKAAS